MARHISRSLIVLYLLFLMTANTIDTVEEDPVEVFYINLESYRARNEAMRRYLERSGLPFRRIEAIQVRETDLPFNLTTAFHPCEDIARRPSFTLESSFLHFTSIEIHSLCISHKNIVNEIAVTLSHIKAILTALSSSNNNKYALILEDDVDFGFTMDFQAMIRAFPPDLELFQMVLSNHRDVQSLFNQYLRKNETFVRRIGGYWCSSAYLIYKPALRSRLRKLVAQVRQKKTKLRIDLIAGSDRNPDRTQGCLPAMCCLQGNDFQHFYPCVMSRNIAADYYIFALGETYMSTIPLFRGGEFALNSTLAGGRASVYKKGLQLGSDIIRGFYEGKYPLPASLKPRSLPLAAHLMMHL